MPRPLGLLGSSVVPVRGSAPSQLISRDSCLGGWGQPGHPPVPSGHHTAYLFSGETESPLPQLPLAHGAAPQSLPQSCVPGSPPRTQQSRGGQSGVGESRERIQSAVDLPLTSGSLLSLWSGLGEATSVPCLWHGHRDIHLWGFEDRVW